MLPATIVAKDLSMKYISTLFLTTLFIPSAIHAMEQESLKSYTTEYALTFIAKLSHVNFTQGEYRLKHEFDLTKKTCGKNYCTYNAPLYCREHQTYTMKNDTLTVAEPMTHRRYPEGSDSPGPLLASTYKDMVTASIVKATTNLKKGIHGVHDVTLEYSISRPKTNEIVVSAHQLSLEVPINSSDTRVKYSLHVPEKGLFSCFGSGYTQIPLEFTIKSSQVLSLE